MSADWYMVKEWQTAMAKWPSDNPAAAALYDKTEAEKKRRFDKWWIETEAALALEKAIAARKKH